MFFNCQIFTNNYQKFVITHYTWELQKLEDYSGSIKSSIGIGQLLMNGIGDTIRVSLSSDPADDS